MLQKDKNKDEYAHRFSVRGELLERKREREGEREREREGGRKRERERGQTGRDKENDTKSITRKTSPKVKS